MRGILHGAVAVVLGLAVLPAFAADDKKADADKKDAPDAKKDPDKKDVNTKDSLKAGELVGKLTNVDETKKAIKLQITIEYPELNVGEAQALAQSERDLAVAQAKRDFQGVLNAQNAMAQHQAKLYNVKSQTKDLDLQTIEDVKVRLANPPPQYDAKGNIKKLTEAEKKELKGPDPSLPGYQAEFANLHNEQFVKVTLVKKKDAPKHPPKGKDLDPEALLENLPQISMIEILGEPPPK
jgi:hypothetical protein